MRFGSLELVLIVLSTVAAFFLARGKEPRTLAGAIASIVIAASLLVSNQLLWARTERGLVDHATCWGFPQSKACKARILESASAPKSESELIQKASSGSEAVESAEPTVRQTEPTTSGLASLSPDLASVVRRAQDSAEKGRRQAELGRSAATRAKGVEAKAEAGVDGYGVGYSDSLTFGRFSPGIEGDFLTIKQTGVRQCDRLSGTYSSKRSEGLAQYIFCPNNPNVLGATEYAGNITGFGDTDIAGFGQMSFSDGRRFEGQFYEGAPHGAGTMHYPDGTRYEGRFSNGERVGLGALWSADGALLNR